MTEEELFHGLAEHLPPACERTYPGCNSCILTTRIAVAVGDYFGLKIGHTATSVICVNKPMHDRIVERGWPSSRKQTIEWCDEIGGWSCGTTGDTDTHGYGFHVVAMTPSLIGDFSVGQYSRPQYNMELLPALVGPLYFNNHGVMVVENGLGAAIRYELRTDKEYLTTPNWAYPSRWRKLAGEMIRVLREPK